MLGHPFDKDYLKTFELGAALQGPDAVTSCTPTHGPTVSVGYSPFLTMLCLQERFMTCFVETFGQDFGPALLKQASDVHPEIKHRTMLVVQ